MAMLLCAMFAELLGGVATDYLLRRTRQPADCALAADRRQLGSRGGGAGAGDPRPRFGYRAGRLYGRVVLPRLCDLAAVDRDDGHSTQLRRLVERADECRRRGCRNSLAGRLRLDPRPDRQLDDAVRLLGRSVAVRHCHDPLDSARSPDQRPCRGSAAWRWPGIRRAARMRGCAAPRLLPQSTDQTRPAINEEPTPPCSTSL